MLENKHKKRKALSIEFPINFASKVSLKLRRSYEGDDKRQNGEGQYFAREINHHKVVFQTAGKPEQGQENSLMG